MWNVPWKKLRRVVISLLFLGGFVALVIYNIEKEEQGDKKRPLLTGNIGRVADTARDSHSSDNLKARGNKKPMMDAVSNIEDNIRAVLPHANKHIKPNIAGNAVDRLVTQCKMKKSIAFLKVHKAGSHTTACILQRFGFEHGLNFVLPKKCPSVNLGFPGGLTDNILMHQKVDEYNLLVHHTVYDREKFHQLMAPGTQFITVLREPLSHLRSCFYYFGMDKKTGLVLDKDPLAKYLDNPGLYEFSSVAKKARVTMTKNLQAFVLGWKDRYYQDRGAVRKFISQLDKDFPLVLILEYFDASLVLLKRLMCWTFYNILYDKQHRNQQIYMKQETAYTEQQRQNHRNSSWVDYQLYEHFNSSLWKKIVAAGKDFKEELAAFQKLNDGVNNYCREETTKNKTFPGSKLSGPIEIGPKFCEELKKERKQWDIKICQRAGAYGEKEMYIKEESFQKSRANPKPVKPKRPLNKTETELFLAKVKESFPGMNFNTLLKKSNVSVAKIIKATREGKYSVDEAVKLVKKYVQSKKQ